MRRLLGITMLSFLFLDAGAQDMTLHGYLENLVGWVSQPPGAGTIPSGHFQNSLQNRLNIRYDPLLALRLECDLRTRLIYQQGFNAGGVFASQFAGNGDVLDLNAVLINRDNLVLLGQVDRFYLDWTDGPLQLTFGRQRIAWGTNLVWNPTDLFNPISILDFDYAERPGTDALRVQVFTGSTSKFEVAVAPGKTEDDRTMLALVHLNAWNYDFNVLGGSFQKRYVLGLSWAGQIMEGGFRGEMRWTGNQPSTGAIVPSGTRASYFTAALSGDYTFASSLYLHSELLFNGDGVNVADVPIQATATVRGQLPPAPWSIYQEIAGNISALIRLSIFGLVNPVDASFVLVPSLAWSLATDWDMLLIGLAPGGPSRTEFGGEGSGVFARIQWSF